MERSNEILKTSECAGTSVFLFIAGDFTYLLVHKTLPKHFQKHFVFYLYSKTPCRRGIPERYFLSWLFAFVLEVHASLYNEHEIFFNSFFQCLVFLPALILQELLAIYTTFCWE